MTWAADILALLGLGALLSGVYLVFGIGWALIVGGGLLLSLGLTAAMRRGIK